jgi:hypothetical protein
MKVLSCHLPRETEESHEKLHQALTEHMSTAIPLFQNKVKSYEKIDMKTSKKCTRQFRITERMGKVETVTEFQSKVKGRTPLGLSRYCWRM